MPPNSSQQDIVADLDSTNPNQHYDLDRQDGPGGGANEPDADLRTSGKATTQMAADRISSTSSNLPDEELRNRPVNQPQPGPSSKNGRQSSQEGLLQIPSEGGVTRRPLETSIWDWDTPLESVGESSSYYYEPQGELLQEQRDQRPARTEFSIPHAIAASSAHWPFPASAVGSIGKDRLAVPQRPYGVPPPLAGNKRKSLSDREGASAGKQPDQKRSFRIMSDTNEEPISPEDARPPAHNTRSQSSPGSRVRSVTEVDDGRTRPAIPEGDTARAQPGASRPRRTLEDPSTPMVLPARKVFPIQIGDKLFRLSGASISSDGKHISMTAPPKETSS